MIVRIALMSLTLFAMGGCGLNASSTVCSENYSAMEDFDGFQFAGLYNVVAGGSACDNAQVKVTQSQVTLTDNCDPDSSVNIGSFHSLDILVGTHKGQTIGIIQGSVGERKVVISFTEITPEEYYDLTTKTTSRVASCRLIYMGSTFVDDQIPEDELRNFLETRPSMELVLRNCDSSDTNINQRS